MAFNCDWNRYDNPINLKVLPERLVRTVTPTVFVRKEIVVCKYRRTRLKKKNLFVYITPVTFLLG